MNIESNNTIEVKGTVNEYDIIQMAQMVDFYTRKAQEARQEAQAMLGNAKSNAIVFPGQKGASFAEVDPGATWMSLAKETEAALLVLHRRKMEATFENAPDAKITIISTAKEAKVVTPKEQATPISDKPVKTEKKEEPAKKETAAPAAKKEEDKEEGPEQKRNRLAKEALEAFRQVNFENEQKEQISALVKSSKEGVFTTDTEGNFVPATDEDRNDPTKVVNNRMVDGKSYEVKFEVKKEDGKPVLGADKKPVKGEMLKDKNGNPLPVSNKDKKNLNLIVETVTPRVEIEVARTLHDIEKAVNIMREVLVGMGIQNIELLSYRDLKIRCNAVSHEVDKASNQATKEGAAELLKKLDIKIGFDSTKVYEKDGLSKLEGQFTKDDDFNLVVINGGDEVSSKDEIYFEAIRHCAAGLRTKAITLLYTYFKDTGITMEAAEILLNRLMNPKANPYEKLEKTIENHLLNWQKVLVNDVPDGYTKGIPLAKTLLKAFSTVYKVDGKGKRIIENGAPVTVRWSDEYIDKKIDAILNRMERVDLIPVRLTEEEQKELEVQIAEDKATEEASKEAAKEKPKAPAEKVLAKEKKEEKPKSPSKEKPKTDHTKSKEKTKTPSTTAPVDKSTKESKQNKSGDTKTDDKEIPAKPNSSTNAQPGKEAEKPKKSAETVTPKPAESKEEEPASAEPAIPKVPVRVSKVSGNVSKVQVTGTQCEGTTQKTGEALAKYCVNKVKSYMTQVLKDEKRKLKKADYVLKFPRPEALKDWKQGEALTVEIQVED